MTPDRFKCVLARKSTITCFRRPTPPEVRVALLRTPVLDLLPLCSSIIFRLILPTAMENLPRDMGSHHVTAPRGDILPCEGAFVKMVEEMESLCVYGGIHGNWQVAKI